LSIETIKNIYRSKSLGEELPNIRGAPIIKWKNQGLDRHLVISNNGFNVEKTSGI